MEYYNESQLYINKVHILVAAENGERMYYRYIHTLRISSEILDQFPGIYYDES